MREKDVLFFDSELAESEIQTVRRTARGLEALIQVIKKHLPSYQPNIARLEKLFQERDVVSKIATLIESESKHNLTFDNPDETDLQTRSTIVEELRRAIMGISRVKGFPGGDWNYWYFVKTDGSVNIRQGYTGELKKRRTYKLAGNLLQAYNQAFEILKLINESQELLGNNHPLILGLVMKNRANADLSVFQPYEIDEEHFLKRARNGVN